MTKKNLGNLKDALSDLTEDTPSIHTTEKVKEEKKPEKEKGRAPDAKAPVAERNAQYLLKMTREQRRQLVKLAALEDMTIRGFILNALKDKGLDVTEEDMIDLRRTAE